MDTRIPTDLERYTALTSADDGSLTFCETYAEADKPSIIGTLIPYMTLSDRGTFFVPGSGKKTIKEAGANAPHLYQHDPWEPIGKHAKLTEKPEGLVIHVDVNENVNRGAEVMSNYRFGVPMGLSAGLDRIASRPGNKDDERALSRKAAPSYMRNLPIEEFTAITEYALWESSTVTFAAIGGAKATEINSSGAGSLDILILGLKAGTLTDDQLGQVRRLVDAYTATAGAGTDHSTDEDQADRLEIEALAVMAGYAGITALELAHV